MSKLPSSLEGQESPQKNSSWLGDIAFSWMFPILRKVRKTKKLEVQNLYDIGDSFQAHSNAQLFMAAWEKEVATRKSPSIFRTVVFGLGRWFFIACLNYVMRTIFMLIQPVFFLLLLNFYTDVDSPVSTGIGYVIGLCVFITLGVIFDHQYQWKSQQSLVKIRAGLLSAIYQKALKLRISSDDQAGLSVWVNSMSVDAENVKSLMEILGALVLTPIEVLGVVGIMYYMVREATFAGLGLMLISVYGTRLAGQKISKTGREKSKLTGQRTNLLSEIVNGIKAIKFFAWEAEFTRKIREIRKDEESSLRKMANWIIVSMTITLGTPTLVTAIVFVVNFYQFGGLKVQAVYPTLILLGMLRSILYNLPQYQARFVSARVSMKRLEEFFNQPEIIPSNTSDSSLPLGSVKIENGSFAWSSSKSDEPTLKDINLNVAPSSLVAVVGEVGAGKTSFIMSILGEIPKLSGHVAANGRIAYVPQQAWIMNATIKDNILFGKPFDENRYREVLTVCCLLPDLQIFELGDQTFVGDRGINLSGGQKQRISLARALYFNADIYILDDPLSAVDAHVGKTLFHDCINGMMKGKTRIFVTNQTQYVHYCEEALQLSHGMVIVTGKIPDVLEKLNLDQLAQQKKEKKSKKSKKKPHDEKKKSKKASAISKRTKSSDPSEQELIGSHERYASDESKEDEPIELEKEDHSGDELERFKNEEKEEEIKEEITQVQLKAASGDVPPPLAQMGTSFSIFRLLMGDVDKRRKRKEKKLNEKKLREQKPKRPSTMSLFIQVLRGWWAFLLIIIIQLICTLAVMVQNVVLGFWAAKSFPLSDMEFMGIFLGVCGLYIVFQLARSIFFSRATERTARGVHFDLVQRVLRAPMAFFDLTPTGEILGWFSKDMFLMDVSLHTSVELSFIVSFAAVFYLLFIPINFPWLLLFLLPFGLVIWGLSHFYSPTLVKVKHLEANTCPPIYSHFKETLDGLASIRAFHVEEIFRKESEKKTDSNNRAVYHLFAVDHWLGFGIDVTGNMLALVMTIMIVLSKLYDGILTGVLTVPSHNPEQAIASKAAMAATSLYMAVSVTTTINFMVRNLTEASRILERYDKLVEISKMPIEAPPIIEKNRPRPTWPEKGHLEFKNLFVKYRPDLDFVLRDVTCTIQPSEKVGVVGRTGAGKSSLMSALFRLIEFSSGSVILDGVNISEIGLDDLRSQLAIINQDPVLFSGTVRSNLDPFNKHTDFDIWQALENAMLKDVIDKFSEKLEYKVSANGENFSVGQRQQFTLARAFLRKPKVLVMDEATSSIDNDTDALIQKAIRTSCKEATVLTIAHRLNTIMDCDKIMVLDKGRIAEFDRPSVLLSNPATIFSSMVEATGPVVSKQLRKMVVS